MHLDKLQFIYLGNTSEYKAKLEYAARNSNFSGGDLLNTIPDLAQGNESAVCFYDYCGDQSETGEQPPLLSGSGSIQIGVSKETKTFDEEKKALELGYSVTIATNTNDVEFTDNLDLTLLRLTSRTKQHGRTLPGSHIHNTMLIFDKLKDVAVLLSHDFSVLEMNDAAKELFGVKSSRSDSKKLTDFCRYFGEQGKSEEIIKQLKKHHYWTSETEFTDKSGNEIVSKVVIVPVDIGQHNEENYICILHDITDWKQTERRLRAEELKYRAIVEDQTEMICRWLPDGVLTYVNDKFCNAFGYERDEIIGSNLFTEIPIEDRKIMEQTVERFSVLNPVSVTEHRAQVASGEILWHRWVDHAIFDKQGNLKEIQSVGWDITDRVVATRMKDILLHIAGAASSSVSLEELLKVVHSQLYNLFKADDFYIALYHPDEDAFSFPYMVDTHQQMDSTKKYDRNCSLTGIVFASGEPLVCDEKMHRKLQKAGKVDNFGAPAKIWIGAPLIGVNGPIGVIALQDYTNSKAYNHNDLDLLTAIAENISGFIERKRFEIELHRSEMRLQAILDNTRQAYLLIDKEEKIVACNRVTNDYCRKLFGVTMEIGGSISKYIPEAINEDVLRMMAMAIDGIHSEITHIIKDNQGNGHYFDALYIPIVNEMEEITSVLVSISDVTEHKHAIESVIRSEKRFRSLVRNSSDITLILDNEGTIKYVSDSASTILGYNPADVAGGNIWEFLHPDDHATAVKNFTRVIEGKEGNLQSSLYRVSDRNGQYKYLETMSMNLLNDPDIQGIVVNTRDVTSRMEAEDKLRESESSLEEAQRIAGVGSFTINLENNSLHLSKGFAEIVKQDDDTMPQSLEEYIQFIHPEDRPILYASMEDAQRLGLPFEFDHRILLPDGFIFYVHTIGKPLPNDKGEITAIVGTILDVTESKQIEIQLRKAAEDLADRNRELDISKREADESRAAVEKAAEELRKAYEDAAEARLLAERANEAKSQFLANMSHEIRTPLTAIIGFTQLVKDRLNNDENAEFLQQVLDSGKHLLKLINDILDLSRIEAGKLEISYQAFDITTLLKEVENIYRARINEKGLKLKHYYEVFDELVTLDRVRVHQVVANLVNNAIKFTEKGAIEIFLRKLKNSSGIEIVIADSGVGIPHDRQTEVFDPFYQVITSVRDEKQPGAGLGLSITNRLVKAMGGDIRLESRVGEGSKFTVTFPCQLMDKGIVRSGALSQDFKQTVKNVTSENVTILVADDNIANQRLIQHSLERAGYIVIMANDGVEAVDAFYQPQKFDLVIMDVQMPRMDGYEAIQKIRRTEKGKRVPILCLTAFAMKGDKEKSLLAGADQYLSKPFDPNHLVEIIDQMTYRERALPQKDMFVNDPELRDLRIEYLQTLLDEINQFFQEFPPKEEMKSWGHKLSGSGGSFGLQELTKLGRELEESVEDKSTDDIQLCLGQIAGLIEQILEE